MHAAEGRGNSASLGFGVSALFVLLAVVLCAVGYLQLPRRYRVTAYLEVTLTPTTPQSLAQAQQACIDLLRSPSVLNEVVNGGRFGAGTRHLATVARQPNPAAWLASRLQIRFAANSPILEITLSGDDSAGDSWGDDGLVLYNLIASFERAILNPPPATAAKLGGPAAVKVIQKPLVVRQ
jgi:hypothetical protein